MGFRHGVDGVDGVVEVFESVVGADEADLAIAERPAVVEVSCDVGVVEIDGFAAGGGVLRCSRVLCCCAIPVAQRFPVRANHMSDAP